MYRWSIPSWRKMLRFGVIDSIALLLFALPNLHAQTFGVLNPPGGDTYSANGLTYSADGWIALAEQSSGDGTSSCTGTALTYEQYAEDAYGRWISGDYANQVRSVSIPVQWALYQPQWNGGAPTDDACYKQFLTNMIGAYVAQGYKIALTIAINHGPSWLVDSPSCPNCEYKGQDSAVPVPSGSAGGPSGKVASYYLPNIVFDQQVRNLAGPFVDDAYLFANSIVSSSSGGSRSQVDLVRIGISENGETRFPLAFSCTGGYDLEWWAFDGAAQARASDHARPIQIPDPPDCLFGWYPGAGDPSTNRPTYCSIPSNIQGNREQATLDWWSWYFNALADAHAFLYHRFRKDGYTGPIALVTPGAGTDPDNLLPDLQYLWTQDFTDYEKYNSNETVNAGSAWFVLYDQIIYSLQNVWGQTDIGQMWVDHSSVSANAQPATADDATMNPVALCGHNGPDLQLWLTPMPSSSTNFQMPSSGYQTGNSPDPFSTWSSVRKLRYYAHIEGGLTLMGENPGNNPYTGQYSTQYGYVTGMNDVFTLYNSCGLNELLWAFDNELNASGGNNASTSPATTNGTRTVSKALSCGGGGGGFPGPDATIGNYGTCIANGHTCPN